AVVGELPRRTHNRLQAEGGGWRGFTPRPHGATPSATLRAGV
ncbi:MAG: hypothetical protein QOE61_4782, partial [Micromonosporaceae bacterium]|nr:hypothetical protein [Micromonosporaceae bacterium]